MVKNKILIIILGFFILLFLTNLYFNETMIEGYGRIG